MGNKILAVSATRLPMDHFLSGAIMGGMGAAAIGYNDFLNKKATRADVIKKILKFSVAGGFSAAVAISASNSVANKNYLVAAAKTALGIGGLLLAEKLINLESK